MADKLSTRPILTREQKRRRVRRRWQCFFIGFGSALLSLFLVFCAVMYGPSSYFRNLWINTAMETLHHQWLASALYDTKTIQAVRTRAVIKTPYKVTDPDQVATVSSNIPKDNATALPTSAEDGEHIIHGVGFTKLRGDYGNGWLIKVYDPSRVKLTLSKNYGSHGEHVSDMVTRLSALAGINAGGFLDPGGEGYGGNADQILICDGEEVQGPTTSGTHHMIGITYEHKLVLGTYSNDELKAQKFQYGVEFWPFIIMNGQTLDFSEYMSFQPRTAIGQTKSGTFIFVVIDGRSTVSRGATMAEVASIMQANGAYNAANLDGGSSTVFAYLGKVINTPSTYIGERWVPDAFIISDSTSSSSAAASSASSSTSSAAKK